MALLSRVLVGDAGPDSGGNSPWMSAIELLAEVCNQAPELIQDEAGFSAVVLFKGDDNVCALWLLANGAGRHGFVNCEIL